MNIKLLLLFGIGLIALAEATHLRRLKEQLRRRANRDENNQDDDSSEGNVRPSGLLRRHLRRGGRGPTIVGPPGQRVNFNQMRQNPAVNQNRIYPQQNLIHEDLIKPNQQQLPHNPAYVQVMPQPNQAVNVPAGLFTTANHIQQPPIQGQQVPVGGHFVPVMQNPGYVQQPVPNYQPVVGMQPVTHLNQNPQYVQVVPQMNYPQTPQHVQMNYPQTPQHVQMNYPQTPQHVQHQQLPAVQSVPVSHGPPNSLNNVMLTNGLVPSQQGLPYNQPERNVPQPLHVQPAPVDNSLVHYNNNQNSGLSNNILQPAAHTPNQPSNSFEAETFKPNLLVTNEKIIQQQNPVGQFPNFQSPPLDHLINNILPTTTSEKPTINPRRMDLLYGSNLHEEENSEDETRRDLTVDIDPRMSGSTNGRKTNDENDLRK
uniref:Uncharacterized protein n=1 Tax=Glossina pallidipes TaxID=7398 RepID=A0A1A9ZI59_GLOPL